MSIDDELRAAAQRERDIWISTMTSGQFRQAQAIHLALAELLDDIADDMSDASAAELTYANNDGGVYTAVYPTDGASVSTSIRHGWTTALKVARAINGGAA